MDKKMKSTREFDVKILTKMALFLALIIVSGMIAIPVPAIGVPVVLQNIIIMLTAGFLGKKYGTITIGMFLALVFMGVPILSGGRGGLAVLFSPSGGFLIGFLLCGFIICPMLEKIGSDTYWKILLAFIVGGALFINILGSFTLAYFSHQSLWTGLKMAAFFVPIDIGKSIIAAIIYQRLKKYTVSGEAK
ncbi:biotin transporter BioY [Enterococcus thailandicus]|uniref:biotin transporter BioY n=2 Tax=Enterococcus thailandicus TaxID=417368 RepID=UPI0022EBC0B6|nr:biotin transporter BioY [Enterococcus thailandicus]MDA3975236.1 biotin transporter BioY [Enterococcus thailandicus]MDA3980200.1 biotin transporter BioY [Enterococcus thailandicus]